MKKEIQVTTEVLRKIRIIKIAQCTNLSASATLTYHVGVTEENEIMLRVDGNSSSGYWSREWLELVAIQKVFSEIPADGIITSYTLHSLFKGKSTNSPGFILAALLAEGLVQRSSINDRGYDTTDGKAFFSEIQALIDSGVALNADAKPKGDTKKLSKKKSPSEAAPSA